MQGTDLPLWGMEVDVAAARDELRAAARAADGGTSKVDGFLKSVGLGAFAEQIADLRLGELLDTLPPGVDEAAAIAKAREGGGGVAGRGEQWWGPRASTSRVHPRHGGYGATPSSRASTHAPTIP